MAGLMYGLCMLTAGLCAWLLLRSYCRGRYKLLLWGGLCFCGLTLNNAMLVVDKLIFPDIDLSIWRLLLALASMIVLLYGLVWEAD